MAISAEPNPQTITDFINHNSLITPLLAEAATIITARGFASEFTLELLLYTRLGQLYLTLTETRSYYSATSVVDRRYFNHDWLNAVIEVVRMLANRLAADLPGLRVT